MIPDGVPASLLATLLRPEVMVPPLLWLASTRSDSVTGKRLIANRWHGEGDAALGEAIGDAGWTPTTA
jgi:3-oxoacyl-[acyl-carrier protein] reductase